MVRKQNGFTTIELILVIVVVGLLGGIGWLVYERQGPVQAAEASRSKPAVTKPSTPSDTMQLKLADGKVILQAPKAWTVERDDRAYGLDGRPKVIDGVSLTTQNDKNPGTDPLIVYADVYENPNNLSADKWYEGPYGGGLPMDDVTTSRASINGYDTYYFRQTNSNYDDVNYVFTTPGKAVIIWSRIADKNSAPNENGVVTPSNDHTNMLPAIEKMVKSIQIR